VKTLISEDQIREKVLECAMWVNQEYTDTEVILVFILKGSICFVADLIRELTIPFQIEPISAASYGMRGTVPGPVEITQPVSLSLEGKEVLLVDDIFDTGSTLTEVIKYLERLNPKRVRALVLLRKIRGVLPPLVPDYVCFDIEDRFVVGYGLDYKEHNRGLKAIYTIE